MDEITKAEIRFITELTKRQKFMLSEKQETLRELFYLCDTDEQRSLMHQLITDFYLMEDSVYNLCIFKIADCIMQTGLQDSDIVIMAMCSDHNLDSSQEVAKDIVFALAMKGWAQVKSCNRVDRFMKYYAMGYRHFFVVDDFIGSGHTLFTRSDNFKHQLKDNPYDLRFFFVAGMEDAVNNCINRGEQVYCSFIMKKAITSKFLDKADIEKYSKAMNDLEDKLADTVNATVLNDFRFGYRSSEAIFSRHNKNIPNNVFPIFWWKAYKNNSKRDTMFMRIQDGY